MWILQADSEEENASVFCISFSKEVIIYRKLGLSLFMVMLHFNELSLEKSRIVRDIE